LGIIELKVKATQVANDRCNDHWASRNYVSLDRFEPIQNKRITTENSAHTNHQEGTCGTAQKESMAPPKGLEPLTDWLTASRSTWLSYGGTALRLCTFSFTKVFKFSHFTAKC
jgi:hypothetical protein